MTRVDIEPATPDDISGAVALWRDAACRLIARGMPLWTLEQFSEAEALRQAEAGELIVARHGGQLAACMLVTTGDPLFWPDARGTALYLHKLAARTGLQGGWAERLTEWAVGEALRRGLSALRLDCEPREKLVALYRRCGFTPVDPAPLLFHGHNVLRMERRLSA